MAAVAAMDITTEAWSTTRNFAPWTVCLQGDGWSVFNLSLNRRTQMRKHADYDSSLRE